MDSTQAIIRLWRLCVPSSAGPTSGGDGAITMDLLKEVLERELAGKLSALGGASVDDILDSYMQPDASGVVGFLQYWKGMEEILEACGSRRSRLSSARQHAVDGFYFLRNCILSMGSADVSQNRSVFRVDELRYFIERTIGVAGPDGEAYWRGQAAQLPADDICVTGEEVASAILAWLEELVCVDDMDPEEPSTYLGGSTRSGRTSLSSEGSLLDELESEDSVDDGRFSPDSRQGYPQQPVRQPWGRGGYDSEDSPPGGLQAPGGIPRGPPPRRLPEAPLGARSGGALRGGPPPTQAWQRRLPAFELALDELLQRVDKHPGNQTTGAGADEWRSSIEFHMVTRRRLSAARSNEEVLDLRAFHRFAQEHFATTQRRRPHRAIAAAAQPDRHRWQAASAMCTALTALTRKRKAAGFSAMNAARRQAGGNSGGAAEYQKATLLRELLKSQCETAVILEARCNAAVRVGGLALSLASLQRSRLRDSWVKLCQA